MSRLSVLAALLALTVTSSVADAQRSASRRVSTTIGISKGAGGLTCPFCSNERKGGFAGILGVESMMRPGLRLGVEGEMWMHSGSGATRSVFAVVPVTHLYPSASGSLFLKLGLGVARFTASSDEEELRTTSVSGLVGAGYDIRLSGHRVLVPYVSWMHGNRGTMRLNGAEVTSQGGVALLQYGVALSMR